VPDESELVRADVRRLLAERAGPRRERRFFGATPPYDVELWQRMTGQMGLAGLAVGANDGGQDGDVRMLVGVLAEAGAALLGGPLLSTAGVTAPLVVRLGDAAQRRELLPALLDGTMIAGFAPPRQGAHAECALSRRGDGWVVDGAIQCVLAGSFADLVVLLASLPGGADAFCLVRREASAVEVIDTPTLDLTRPLATWNLRGAPAQVLGGDEAQVRWGIALATVALAAEASGGAARCLEMMLDYAASRTAFGRPIGAYQAIKHKCAEVLVQVESARVAVDACAAALDGADDPSPLAAVAKAVAGDAYTRAATECVLVHGALGFTWEHDAHLHVRRAYTDQSLMGTPRHHRAALARYLAAQRVAS
jgi:alkylation response protein AidB-like acyl-CoA dehydrogenase